MAPRRSNSAHPHRPWRVEQRARTILEGSARDHSVSSLSQATRLLASRSAVPGESQIERGYWLAANPNLIVWPTAPVVWVSVGEDEFLGLVTELARGTFNDKHPPQTVGIREDFDNLFNKPAASLRARHCTILHEMIVGSGANAALGRPRSTRNLLAIASIVGGADVTLGRRRPSSPQASPPARLLDAHVQKP
jgi:hypothetical protein